MGSDGNSKRGSFGYEDVSDEEDVRYNKEIVFRQRNDEKDDGDEDEAGGGGCWKSKCMRQLISWCTLIFCCYSDEFRQNKKKMEELERLKEINGRRMMIAEEDDDDKDDDKKNKGDDKDAEYLMRMQKKREENERLRLLEEERKRREKLEKERKE